MDLLDRFLAQLSALQNVWMPFLLALFLAGIIIGTVIWKVLQWQHGVRVAHLSSQLELYREMSSVSAASSLPAPREATERTSAPVAASSTEPRKEPPARPRVFLEDDITIAKLKGLLKDRTALGAQMAARPYIGKWMKLAGTVVNVMPAGERVAVTINESSDRETGRLPIINLFFSSDIESVSHLNKGDEIRLIGRLDKVEPISILFMDCELTA